MTSDHVVSLFSGAGGMSLGFAKAGVKPSFAADIDKDACETYRANLNVEALEIDLSQPSRSFQKRVHPYREAFALIGGPPCQGFSSAGHKNAKDKRNALIFQYLSLVQHLSPRWFLFENVEGLLTSRRGRGISDLVKEFVGLGYCVRLEKVNFASCGLPQGRKRVILIGNRVGIDFLLPAATHSFNAGKHRNISGLPLAPTLDSALAGLGVCTTDMSRPSTYATPEPATPYDMLMREGNLSGSVSLHVASVPTQLAEVFAQLLPGQTMKHLPKEYWHESYERRAFRRVMDGTPTEKRGGAPSGIKRLDGGLNSLTITSAATREFIHPRENRPLTSRECARLQSFPDWYSFAGKSNSIIRQIGNAFPPLAAEVFARHLMALDGTAGADVACERDRPGGLLGYRLTEALGMSPALAQTDALLNALSAPQTRFLFEDIVTATG